MNPIDVLLSEPFGQTLGWTLLHFVWQGALVALLLALALHLLRRHTAQTRYAVACGALLLLLALPVVTLGVLMPETSASSVVQEALSMKPATTVLGDTPPEAEALAAPATPASWQQNAAALLTTALPWLALLWMTGVLALSMRYLAGWTYTVRLRRRRARAVGQRWHDQLAHLTEQMGVRRTVGLVSSALVQVPMVAGWLRPVILLPVSVFTGLSPRQIEMIIAHELAHIRRHDYLINLLQATCETVLFYHPAVWWVSARIRIEREHCCDDLVVAVCGDAYTYAAALAKMETVRQTTPRLAMAATGGSLLDRVRRLLEGPADTAPRAARWLAGLAVLATFLLSLYLSSAFEGVWGQTYTWIDEARTEQTLSPSGQGLLRIHTRDERGVRVEDLGDDEAQAFTVKGPDVKYKMAADAMLSVYDDGQPVKGQFNPEDKTVTFTGDLTLSIWKNNKRQIRMTTYDAILVYVLPTEEDEHAQRPVNLSNGYEKTALLLEQLIFANRRTSVQLEALDELRALPKLACLPSLIKIAQQHPRVQVRLEAVQWVGLLDGTFAVFQLQTIALEDESRAVQMEALDALRNLGQIGIPGLNTIAQTHPRAAMRSEAVQWLGRLGGEVARVSLERILFGDANPDVQREAFDMLLKLPLSLDVDRLHQIAQTHPNEAIREEAVAERRRRQGYTSEAGGLRREARRMAQRLFEQEVNQQRYQNTAERLEALVFSDETETVQMETLKELVKLPGETALTSLANIADRHANEQIRRTAQLYMTMARVRAVADQLEKTKWNQALEDLEKDQVSLRIEAVKTLEGLKTGNVFFILSDVAFEDPSLEVQMEALDALRDRGGLEGMARVARIARSHPNTAMRIEAIQSIDVMNPGDRLPLLAELIFRDDDLDVRTEALELLIDAPEADALPILEKISRRENLPASLREAAAEALAER